MLLGNGHYSNNWFETGLLQARLLFQMNMRTESDEVVIVSDESWKTSEGPIISVRHLSKRIFNQTKITVALCHKLKAFHTCIEQCL